MISGVLIIHDVLIYYINGNKKSLIDLMLSMFFYERQREREVVAESRRVCLACIGDTVDQALTAYIISEFLAVSELAILMPTHQNGTT